MPTRPVNEEHCLMFVRSAFEVSAAQYEMILAQRAAGTRQRMTAKKKRLLREIAEYHQRLGDLIERAAPNQKKKNK